MLRVWPVLTDVMVTVAPAPVLSVIVRELSARLRKYGVAYLSMEQLANP